MRTSRGCLGHTQSIAWRFLLPTSIVGIIAGSPFVLLKGGNDRVRFDVSKWPAIRAELDRMIAFMTGSPEAPSEQVQGQGEK